MNQPHVKRTCHFVDFALGLRCNHEESKKDEQINGFFHRAEISL